MASGNPGKLREIARILSDLDLTVVPQSDFNLGDVDESGDTFVANALIKARHAASATGLPAIADDSGLVVDALDGRPGVYSARFAGPERDDDANIDKLLQELAQVAEADRGAAFQCAHRAAGLYCTDVGASPAPKIEHSRRRVPQRIE